MSLFGAVWMADLRIDRPYQPIIGKNTVLGIMVFGVGMMRMKGKRNRTKGWGDYPYQKRKSSHCRKYISGSGLCSDTITEVTWLGDIKGWIVMFRSLFQFCQFHWNYKRKV
jgi:hypothetical protein